MCLNWKVAAALAVVAGGIYLLVPSVFAAALPLLVVALCPLSMLLMMRMMSGGGRTSCGAEDARGAAAKTQSQADLETELARLRADQAAIEDRLGAIMSSDAKPAVQQGTASR